MTLLAIVAATRTPLERLKELPPIFWMKIGFAVLAVIVTIVILRKLAQSNKIILSIVFLVVLSIIGFSWIYDRNEPAWATPFVEKVAPFFPAKGAYTTKQQSTPKP